jgi:hypothetical protein
MMALDMKRLIALMGMTDSVGDGEALNAVRMANRMLKTAGKTWAEVLTPARLDINFGTTPDYRTPPSRRKQSWGTTVKRGTRNPDRGRNTGSDIDAMLGALSSRKHDMSTMMFIASLNDHWERKSFLTDPQYEALKALHSRGRF